LQIGDQVRVTIDDKYLLLGSVLLYMLPLLIMFAGIGLANTLLPAATSEDWLPEIALTGLLLAFRMLNRLQN
jgi:positive regulator of sigma E activity